MGGHRSFRPSALAARLRHLDVISIGAAGTFVVRRAVGVAELRDEFFSAHPVRPDVVRFVSVLARSPRVSPQVPLDLPADGPWMVKVLAREGRFLVGVYRRRMSAIRQLGALDRLFGVPVTTRNWNTVGAIADVLERSS